MLPEEFLNQLIPHMLHVLSRVNVFMEVPVVQVRVSSIILEIYEKPEDFFLGKSCGVIPQKLFHILLRK